MSRDHTIRCGDTVVHKPTGETWLVAYADYGTGDLAWSGWPDGRARIADCEISRFATDEQHAKHVAEWLSPPAREDHRTAVIRRLYGSN